MSTATPTRQLAEPDRLMTAIDWTMDPETAVVLADLAEVAQERDEAVADLAAAHLTIAEQAALIEELRAALDLATVPARTVQGRPASTYARAA
jgi:hypothetical protein